jgi:hypothetical protein
VLSDKTKGGCSLFFTYQWRFPTRHQALGWIWGQSTQHLAEMSTRNHRMRNLTAICEPTVEQMWEPRRLTTLWASTPCYKDSFTFCLMSVSIKIDVRWGYFTTDGRAVSQYVLVSSTLVGLATRHYFLSECCCLKFAVLFLWGALSDENTGLQFAV